MKEKGIEQLSDVSAIEKLCDEVIAANPKPVADFRAGNVASLNFLKGQVIKLSKGKANPQIGRRNFGAETESVAAVCHSERSRGIPRCNRWVTRRDPSTSLPLRSE